MNQTLAFDLVSKTTANLFDVENGAKNRVVLGSQLQHSKRVQKTVRINTFFTCLNVGRSIETKGKFSF